MVFNCSSVGSNYRSMLTITNIVSSPLIERDLNTRQNYANSRIKSKNRRFIKVGNSADSVYKIYSVVNNLY